MKRILSLLAVAMVGMVGVAQNIMTVHKTDNSQIRISLDEFQSTSFDVSNVSNPQMVITKNDNSQVLVPLSDLDHTSFDEVTPPDVELDYSQITVEPFRYGYSQLDDQKKAAYDIFYNSIVNFQQTTTTVGETHLAPLDAGSVNYYPDNLELQSFLKRMQKDCPELFLLNTYVPRYSGGKYNAQIQYSTTERWIPSTYAQMMSDIDAKVNEILVGVYPSMSDYEKIRMLHDNFGYKVHFGDLYGADAQTIIGGIYNGKGVCQGLAVSWLYACQKAGIKCIYISGMRHTDNGDGNIKEENHAWNYVQCDGKWYMIDMADDLGFGTMTTHNRFLRGSNEQSQYYRLYYQDNSDPNACYDGLPTLEENDYPCDRPIIYL